MSKILVIAWREFKATVFTWAFFLSVVLVPLLAIGMSVATPLIAERSGAFERQPVSGEVWVVGEADLAEALGFEARADTLLAEITVSSGPDTETALARLRSGDALAVVDSASGVTLYLGDVRSRDRRTLSNWVAKAGARHRATGAGLDLEDVRRLLEEEPPEVVMLSDLGQQSGDEQAQREATEILLASMAEMLLWLGVFVSAQYLLHNTIEERSSKVMEVLLSAVSPFQLMAGKILGLGVVGAVLTCAYGSALIAGLVALAATDLLTFGKLALFAVFYVLAYLQMGAVFAAIGSAVNDVREAQSLMTPAVVLMTLPFLCLPALLNDANSGLAVGLSLVPPLTPYVMIFRILMPSTVVPAWQIGVSLVLATAWAAAMLWMSGRVFRVGVLMRGKAPGPVELARWIFER